MSSLLGGLALPRYTRMDLGSTAARLQRACAARSGEQMSAFLAENVVAMYHGQPVPIVGREANRQAWSALFETAGLVNPITLDEVVESEQGDLGYTFGRWWQRQPGNGPLQGGHWVAIWQPVDGAWQIIYLSANAHDDVAAEAPATQ